jgi:monovalent cation:proton antiporter-2 (CPA2) family protein
MGGAFFQAFIYLAAAMVAVPVTTRLGLGSVLGYLVAGAVIGPYALNLAGDAQTIGQIAEFGVVILLFLIGLELRPARLWQLRTLIIGLGLSQVLVTGLILAGAAFLLGIAPSASLVTGFVLAMSSTAIVLQMLEEKGISNGAVGRAAFGVLLLQDLAVIPLLALLPLAGSIHSAAGHGTSFLAAYPLWLRACASLGAVALVLVGGLYLSRPILRVVAATRLREVFTASALLIVVSVALLMQAVGLSPALGAFLAGLVLAESEYRRELETDIEPFRGLLLGVFFVTVGAGLNFPLVAEQPWLLAVLVVGLMTTKALVLTLIGRAFRLPWQSAGLLGVALAQGGEFAFVLLSLAAAVGALAPDYAVILTAAVALSMAASPPLLALYERVSRPRAKAPPEADGNYDIEEPAVLVAGYGRFGQVVARVLTANGYETSVLENSVEQVELVRLFGRRVFYGDASRLDLLRAAGAAKAKVLVVAIDDREKADEIVETAREEFPHLTVIARAFDRRHAYNLLDRGAHRVERELFEGGLAAAAQVLVALGWRAYRARRAASIFRRHDERLFDELRPLWHDETRFRDASRESSPRMENLLREDMARLRPDLNPAGWDTDSLYDEMGE